MTETEAAPVENTSLFCRDGFALLDGFIDDAELPEFREEVDALLAGPLPAGCERPHNTLAPLRWTDGLIGSVLASESRQRLLEAVVSAADLRWISAYISVKDAHSPALWWHQDWWCWDHPVSYRREAAQVAVLCYLTDTTTQSGALRVLPGTHHRSLPLHDALPEAHTSQNGVANTHEAMRDHADQRTLELRAGDAVVLDYRLLHGTHPNSSEKRRDCLLLSFTPSWRDLPLDVRAHLIRHPALPMDDEQPPKASWQVKLLPTFDGQPKDLRLNRVAPKTFRVGG